MIYALRHHSGILRRTTLVPQGIAGFPRESSQPDPRLRRHGCHFTLTPGNRRDPRLRTLYALTSFSRSSATRANLLILRAFRFPFTDVSPCGSVSTAEPLFLHTCRTVVPDVPCLRPGALFEPLVAVFPLGKTYALPTYGRVTEKSHE